MLVIITFSPFPEFQRPRFGHSKKHVFKMIFWPKKLKKIMNKSVKHTSTAVRWILHFAASWIAISYGLFFILTARTPSHSKKHRWIQFIALWCRRGARNHKKNTIFFYIYFGRFFGSSPDVFFDLFFGPFFDVFFAPLAVILDVQNGKKWSPGMKLHESANSTARPEAPIRFFF